ncbi:MAG TPA: hypothetical protein VLX32_04735 [Candidatus Acidoferrum sp.]|nr:hypothetical protein [Candidatus Acidoferrum sp.]
MKKHLLQHCEKSAQHYVAIGKIHAGLESAHESLAEAASGDEAEAHRTIAGLHKEARVAHGNHAEHYLQLHKTFSATSDEDLAFTPRETFRGRGFGAQDLDGPGKVRGATDLSKSPNKLVPRFGGPGGEDDSLAKVDPQHRHLIEADAV